MCSMNKRFNFEKRASKQPRLDWTGPRRHKMSGGNNSYVNLYKFDYDMLHMNMVGLKLKLTLN